MSDVYILKLEGLTRHLPIVAVSDKLKIASFVILGDTELVCRAAEALVKKLPEVDYLITAEAKGIPLIFEMSRLLGMPKYFVARKSVKAYMENPLESTVKSITTHGRQHLYLDERDAQELKGKRIAIIDDVISTGQSLEAVENLVVKAGGVVTARAAILAEGDAASRTDIIFLGELPLFPQP
jgi:adenine phosphoribosyltransferase